MATDSKIDSEPIQISRDMADRILSKMLQSAVEGTPPGSLTWSKEEGAALQTELVAALDRELSPGDSQVLLKQLSGGAAQALFGEGNRRISFKSSDNGIRPL